MVEPATRKHGRLFEHAHARRGLACIHKLGLCTLEGLRHAARIGGDAAHALQVVEGNALARKQDAGIAFDGSQMLARMDLVAISHRRLDRRRRIEQSKRACKHIQAGDNAIRLGNELHFGLARLGAHRCRAHVFERDVLAQRLQDQVVANQFHRNGIHNPLRLLSACVNCLNIHRRISACHRLGHGSAKLSAQRIDA